MGFLVVVVVVGYVYNLHQKGIHVIITHFIEASMLSHNVFLCHITAIEAITSRSVIVIVSGSDGRA